MGVVGPLAPSIVALCSCASPECFLFLLRPQMNVVREARCCCPELANLRVLQAGKDKFPGCCSLCGWARRCCCSHLGCCWSAVLSFLVKPQAACSSLLLLAASSDSCRFCVPAVASCSCQMLSPDALAAQKSAEASRNGDRQWLQVPQWTSMVHCDITTLQWM